MIRSRFRVVVNRYLNENTYNLIKNAYLAVHKRPDLTSAEELEELKDAIVDGMEVDEVAKEEKYLLKAGHGGTLDSMATGVLGHVTKEKLIDMLEEFKGEIWQVPPVYSALKIGGERSSDLVRLGREVKLLPRPVMCYSIHCVEFSPPYFTLDVSCGSGFYVRSLVHDLAEALGSCAHVTALVRTKHGPFTLQDCLHPEDYSRENIIKAALEAHRKYPKLAEHIRNYFESKRHSKHDRSKKPRYQTKNNEHM